MTNFFMGEGDDDKVTFSMPRLDKVNFVLGLELEKLKNYYMDSEKKVDRPNLLINLINNSEVGNNVNDIEAKLYIETNGIYIGKLLGITSEISNGEIFKDTIVKGSKEIFINTDFKKTNEINEYNYLDYTPIKNVYNNNDSIALNHPTKFKQLESAFFIYEIDIPLLALQYRYWESDRIANDLSTDIAIFIYTVPLVKIMDSILSTSLINRFFNLYLNSKATKYDSNLNPLSVIDLYDRLDKEYISLIKNLKRKNNITLENFLRSIPTPYGNSYETLQLTNNYITSQNEYAFILSRINYVLIFLKILPKSMWVRNKFFLNDTKMEIKYFLRNNNFSKIKDSDIKNKLLKTIDEIKTKIKGL